MSIETPKNETQETPKAPRQRKPRQTARQTANKPRTRAKPAVKRSTARKPKASPTTARKAADRGLLKVRIKAKGNPFRKGIKRHEKWKCLKTGRTVSDCVKIADKRGLAALRTFIGNCERMGHLTLTRK